MTLTEFIGKVWHYSHPVMIAGMACTAVVASAGAAAAAAPAGAAAAAAPAFTAAAAGAPLQISGLDIVAAGVDSAWSMLAGVADVPEVLGSVWDSLQNGTFFELNYDMGSASHGAHVMDVGAHVSGHGGGAIESGTSSVLQAVLGDPSLGHGIEHAADHGLGHGFDIAASGVEHADSHIGHCTMDTHGAIFDRWSEDEYGGFFSAMFGDVPTPSEQWSQFSDVLCPK